MSSMSLFSSLFYLALCLFLYTVWTECGSKAILLIFLLIFEMIVGLLLCFIYVIPLDFVRR